MDCAVCKCLGRSCNPECGFLGFVPGESAENFREIYVIYGLEQITLQLNMNYHKLPGMRAFLYKQMLSVAKRRIEKIGKENADMLFKLRKEVDCPPAENSNDKGDFEGLSEEDKSIKLANEDLKNDIAKMRQTIEKLKEELAVRAAGSHFLEGGQDTSGMGDLGPPYGDLMDTVDKKGLGKMPGHDDEGESNKTELVILSSESDEEQGEH